MIATLVVTTGVGAAAPSSTGSGWVSLTPGRGALNVQVTDGGAKSGTGARPAAYDPHAWTCVYLTPPANQDSIYAVAAPPAGQTSADGRSMNQFCSQAWVVAKGAGLADPLAACPANLTCVVNYGIWVRNATPSPAVVARTLFASLGLARPQIHTSPDASHHLLVSLPTWLWIDGKTADQSVTRNGITVTAHLTVAWSTDEGSVSCTTAGTPYVSGSSDPRAASPDCGHTFVSGGGHAITARVNWAGSFSVNGGAPTPIATPIAWTVVRPVTVDEVQTVNS